jgi:hypothetical protein
MGQHESYISAEVLASAIGPVSEDGMETEVDGRRVRLSLTRA